MRPNHINTITHQGTIAQNSKAVQFGIDQGAMAHIMSLLTDLYSDRPGAVIREYSTNALDSHIAAGVDEPIEIELPTRWNATLVIRDHGLGMSKEDIERIYGQYGTSTKRDTDTQNGMLGLGSKSALTYTSQFTLVGIKDNLRTTVLITRNEDGVGVLQFIGEPVHTDDRNGVEISIPVVDADEMRLKAQEFFQYWQPGTVLVDGQEPEYIFNHKDALVVEDDTIILLPVDGYRRKSRIIMAGVAYPFTLTGPVADHFDAIVHVETGAVSFTPSREALMENSLTNDTVRTVNDFVNHHFIAMLQKQLDGCETPIEALQMFDGNEAMRKYNLAWRGTKMKTGATSRGWRWERGGWSSRATQINGNIRLMDLLNSKMIIVGSPRPTATIKDKASHYLDTEGRPAGMLTDRYGHAGRSIYFLEENPAPGWLDAVVVDYETIKAVKLPKSESAPKTQQPKTKYRIWDRYASLIYVDDLPEDATLVWVPARSGLDDNAKSLLMGYIHDYHVTEKRDDVTGVFSTERRVAVVNVLKHKVERFLKDHPDAMTPKEFVEAEVKAIDGSITPLMAWRHQGGYDRPWPNKSDLLGSDDPDLLRLINGIYNVGSADEAATYSRWTDLRRLCGWFETDNPSEPSTQEWDDLYALVKSRYPWLWGYRNAPPVAWMLKAWYRHTQQEALLDQMMVTNDYIIPVDLKKRGK